MNSRISQLAAAQLVTLALAGPAAAAGGREAPPAPAKAPMTLKAVEGGKPNPEMAQRIKARLEAHMARQHEERFGCADAPARAMKAMPFGPGERLIYRVDALGVWAGKVELQVGKVGTRNKVQVIGVKGVSEPNSFFMKIRPTEGYTAVFIDTQTLLPVAQDSDVIELHERKFHKIHFNRKSKTAEGEFIRGPRHFNKNHPLFPYTTDPMSVFFHLRTRKLELGTALCYDMVAGLALWRVRGKVVRTETIITGAGRIDTWVLEGEAARVDQQAPARAVRLWVARDQDQLPVRIETSMGWGSVSAELVKHKPAAAEDRLWNGVRSARK